MATGMESKTKILPKYRKSYGELKRTLQPGDAVTLTMRRLNFKTGAWDVVQRDFHATEIAANCLVVRERQAGIPWYAIHDWEIVPIN